MDSAAAGLLFHFAVTSAADIIDERRAHDSGDPIFANMHTTRTSVPPKLDSLDRLDPTDRLALYLDLEALQHLINGGLDTRAIHFQTGQQEGLCGYLHASRHNVVFIAYYDKAVGFHANPTTILATRDAAIGTPPILNV